MDALFEKLDRLSSPFGSLLDAALNRMAPHVTASAASCSGTICSVTCSGECGAAGGGHQIEYLHYGTTSACTSIKAVCPNGCRCF